MYNIEKMSIYDLMIVNTYREKIWSLILSAYNKLKTEIYIFKQNMNTGPEIQHSYEAASDTLVVDETKKETNDLLSGIFGKKFTDLLDKVSKVLWGISGAFGGNKESDTTSVSEQKNSETSTTVVEKKNTNEWVQDRQQLAMIDKYKGTDKEAFGNKLIQVSNNLGINPNWLMAVMWKECRLNPKAVNKNGWASWLIQFMPKTAKWLWTSVEAIRTMSALDQLDYVEKYMKTYASKIHSYEDTYLAVFYPAYLGKADDKRLPANVIAQNPWVGKTVWQFTNHYAYRDIPDDAKEMLA